MASSLSLSFRLSVALVLLGAAGAYAQDSVMSPTTTVEPPVLGQVNATSIETNEPALPIGDPGTPTSVPAAEDIAATATGNAVADTPRRFHYSLRMQIRGVYDDNINIRPTNKVSDYYFAIEPGISLGLGDVEARQENFIGFDYSPSILRYFDHSEADSDQHFITIAGQYRASRLTLNLTQNVQILNNATIVENTNEVVNRDVASRTSVNIYTTKLGGSYYVAGKTFLSSDLGATVTDYKSLISSEVYFGDLFINYDYSPKVTFGIGGGGGYNPVDPPSPNQTFEQVRGRMSYNASGKITFNGSVGAEFREFDNSSRDIYISPVFDLGATYQPFDGTNIQLNGSRQTFNSAALGGQDFSSTTLSLSLRQRFLQRFTLGVMLSYENADYFSTVTNQTFDSDRSDNYISVQPTVDVAVTRFWSVGAFYLHRRDDSSIESFSFQENQVGFRTSLKF
jgi:hypothetical protein